jgi:localization factor PodJL
VALPATVAAADQSMPMHTASARTQPPSAAAPSVPARRADHTAITAGIVLDQGGATPSVQELRRATHEQRMAQMSNDVGSRAVQSSQREVAAAAKPAPASLTPDATRPEAQVSDAPAAAARRDLSGGMPPAQIGPNSLRLAAAKGDPSAEFEVASRYAQGKGVAKDFAKAAEWYGRAASKGFAPAQYRLGGLHERGIGVPADLARARAWYRRAAELGNVKAMHNLAVMHTQRNGAAEPEYTTAAHWFAEAAERGLADSQFNLAILYDNGMGVAKSPAEAWKWFALAAGQGDGEAGKRREAIGQRMQPAELAALRNTVAGWRPKAVDQVANDPFAAGQAWRNRNGEPSASASTPAVRRAPAEAEIIDLTEEAMQPKAQPTAAAGGGAGGDKQRRSVQTKDQVDVERLLTQHGYDPSKLKGKPAAGAPATD